MNPFVLVTVDPGLDGAYVVCATGSVTGVYDLPTMHVPGIVTRAIDPAALAAQWRSMHATSFVVEAVASRPGQGVAGVFSLGRTFGTLLAVAAALGWAAPTFVQPAAWKRALGLLKAEKGASLQLARELYPELAPLLARAKDHNRAEALLIHHYHWRH